MLHLAWLAPVPQRAGDGRGDAQLPNQRLEQDRARVGTGVLGGNLAITSSSNLS
jgi:hypothetical protein